MGLSKSGGAQEVKIPGFALRFPRLVDFRDDKVPEDATSVKEVEEMFKLQKKK
jgi:DNA ligase-1